jgi:2-(3-amino-3-carboxypropyl)histidine synthase
MSKTIGSYLLDTTELDSICKTKSLEQVFLQIPEGFQHYALEIKQWLEESYKLVVILDAQANYGACDIPPESMLKNLRIDAVIQIGHLPIPSMNMKKRAIPVIFINAQSTLRVSEIIEKSIQKLTGCRIGLVTTAQHIHLIHEMKSLLEKNGLTVIIGQGDKRIYTPGQVLGCNFSSAKTISDDIDSFLFVGTGFFHPLGLLLSTNKPVVIADPYLNKVIDSIDLHEKKQELLRQRYGAITFAKQAKIIAIIIGLKPGQMRNDEAITLYKKVIKAGKKCLLISSDAIHPNFCDSFSFVDVFISTACPRIAIDDYTAYKKPILTPFELLIALHEKSWDDYKFDEIT